MNRENFEKLLQANREAKPELFNMGLLLGTATACGTPACLLGNYALRTDLQNVFRAKEPGQCQNYPHVVARPTGAFVHLNGEIVCEHFDITSDQAERLFDADGCNNAGTNRDKALAYVEHFMATGETPHDDDEEDGWTDEEDDGE